MELDIKKEIEAQNSDQGMTADSLDHVVNSVLTGKDRQFKIDVKDEPEDETDPLSEQMQLNTKSFQRKTAVKMGQRRLYPCSICDKVFTQNSNLKRHMYTHTDTINDQMQLNTKSFQRKTADEMGQKRLYPCMICDKVFKQNFSLRRHMNTHTGSRPYLCSICGKGFNDPSGLKVHESTHREDRPYVCGLCHVSYTTSTYLKKHMRLMHSNNGRKVKLICTECGQQFKWANGLRNHMAKHRGETRYKCDLCNKGFMEASKFKRHVLVHIGGEYKCVVCSKTYPTQYDLNRHARIHTGDRPYTCSTCGKSFTQYPHLKEHVLRHAREKSYSCDQCEKAFYNRTELRQHHRIHDGHGLHGCGLCGKQFTLACHLRQHLKGHKKTLQKNKKERT